MGESHRTSQARRDGGGSRVGVRWAHAVGLLGAVILLLGFTGLVRAGAAQASQTGTAAGRGWQVEPTPNQPGSGINEFSAVE
jgi:hypothetical protein